MRLRPSVLILVIALRTIPATAQASGVAPRTSGTSISGVVRDSISGAPLTGAIVQLVSADSLPDFVRSSFSDSLGRYTLTDVPDGRFTIGFEHPLLDSLGVEPTLRQVVVARHRAVRFDLAAPSASRMREAICGAAASAGAVFAGVVRDAKSGEPVAGAHVTGEWLELTFRTTGVQRTRPSLTAMTRDNGRFALCDVPSGGTMFVTATHEADSTATIEVRVSADGYSRREFFLGAPHVRDGRLRGTVVTADGGRPLAGAIVRVADGPAARTNERGEWMIVGAPAGTRVLETRAIGYYADRLVVDVVDVVADAPAVRVALSTFKAMLETVKITAARVADRFNSGFEERSRAEAGKFLRPSDIARRGAIRVSDLFRSIAGTHVGFTSELLSSDMDRTPKVVDFDERLVLMRGIGGRWCQPVIYFNGTPLRALTADDIDNLAELKDLAGIEVYSDATVPGQYQPQMSGCGVILIWTK
jgi:hypothetical protein